MIIRLKVMSLLLIYLLLLSQHLQISYAQIEHPVFYVDADHPYAQDAEDHGSIEQPWKTLAYAFQQLNPGDTLLVREGLYRNTQINLNDQNSGQEDAPIVVKAYPNETVILESGDTIILRGTQWWILDGFVFQNFDNVMLRLGTENAIAKNIVIRNSIFRDSTNNPIVVLYAEDVLIENNHFARINTQLPDVGANTIEILRWAKRVTVRNNKFEDNAADGIQMGGTTNPVIENITIAGNEFWMSTDQFEWGENGIDIKTVQGPIFILENYIHGFRPTFRGTIGHKGGSNGAGIVIHLGAENIHLERNIFENNTTNVTVASQDGYPPTKNITIVNNLFKAAHDFEGNNDRPAKVGRALNVANVGEGLNIYHNTFVANDAYLASKETTGIFKNNAIIGGMDYVDEESSWDADYNAWSQIEGNIPPPLQGSHDLLIADLRLDSGLHPMSDSPLIDRGENLGIFEDFDGNARDNTPDIGAFEYASNSPTNTPTPESAATPFPSPATPTPTPTNELPTPEPTSPTPVPNQITLISSGPTSVNPGETFRVDVVAKNITTPGLYGIQFEINYDPTLISVSNSQINANLIFVAENEADNTIGKVKMAASQQGRVSGLTGDVIVLSFDATAANTSSQVTFNFENEKISDSQAQSLAVSTQPYSVSIGSNGVTPEPTPQPTIEPPPTITAMPPTPEPTVYPTPEPTDEPPISMIISGQVILTGRNNDNWSDAIVSIENGGITSFTDVDGLFRFTDVPAELLGNIAAEAPGYLPAVCNEISMVASNIVLNPITLLSGDINNDNLVDIVDATAVGTDFGQTGINSPVDITRDNIIDIFDIVLVSVNFGEIGPTEWNCVTN